jgi:hypothetical protein
MRKLFLFFKYNNQKVSNDSRSLMIGNPPFRIYYGKWTIYKNSSHGVEGIYINLVVNTKEEAIAARRKYCPPISKIPSFVYFEIWTSDSTFIAGRDRLNDYELVR